MNTRTVLFAIAVLGVSAYCVSAKGVLPVYGGNSGCCSAKNLVCPQCHCEVTTEEGKVTKHCYEIECEQICIPKVRIPWHLLGQKFSRKSKCDTGGCETPDCSPPPCGKVRTIRVLKKKEYECKVCKCKWTPVCNEGGCDTGSAGVDEGGDAALPPSPVRSNERNYTIPRPEYEGGDTATYSPVPPATSASYRATQKRSPPIPDEYPFSDYFQTDETY